jgi:hypothetical protein
MGINVEARWISEDIGYGIYPLREIHPDTNVTTLFSCYKYCFFLKTWELDNSEIYGHRKSLFFA